jgi:hypothetical protein
VRSPCHLLCPEQRSNGPAKFGMAEWVCRMKLRCSNAAICRSSDIEGYRYGCADPHDTQPTTRIHRESGDSCLEGPLRRSGRSPWGAVSLGVYYWVRSPAVRRRPC